MQERAGSPDLPFGGLHVVLVGPLPPPSGGMAGQTRQLGELLGQAGAKVTLVQTNAPYWPGWLARWRGVRAFGRLIPYLVRLWRSCGRADIVHLMANSGWSWHLFCVPALWIAWMRGVPVVVNYRGGEAAEFLARSARLVRFSMRRAAQLIVPSGFLLQIFADHGMPARTVPNVVNLDRFRPGVAGGPHAPPDIIVARNLEPLYDNATAIRALARVVRERPQARLFIAGSGPEEARLRQLADELGVGESVHLVGRLERDAMAQLLRRCRIALNPSLADNMPNSMLEAMASGVPIVSTNVGGVPHLLEPERTALLVPAGDDEAMARALLRLLDDDELASRLSVAALAEVQRYTWARVAPLLVDVYRMHGRRGLDGVTA